jgi:hypothetical protein
MTKEIIREYRIAKIDEAGKLYINDENKLSLDYIEMHINSEDIGCSGKVIFNAFTIKDNTLYLEYWLNNE